MITDMTKNDEVLQSREKQTRTPTPLVRLLHAGNLRYELNLSVDSRGDGWFFRRQRVRAAAGKVLVIFIAATENRAKKIRFEQDLRKGVESRSVAPFGTLHRDAQPERCFGYAVFEQDGACNDFKMVTFDTIEDPLYVMNENHGIFESMQFIGTDTCTEAESSQHAGQTSDINRHAEVSAKKRAGVWAICRQVSGVKALGARTGYKLQFSFTVTEAHACTCARSRVQTCRKAAGSPMRSEVSTFAHGAQCFRSLPARRSQMFPQRSQYFSSILLVCNVAILFFINSPLTKKSLTQAEGEVCLRWDFSKDHTTAGDRARFFCDDLFVLFT